MQTLEPSPKVATGFVPRTNGSGIDTVVPAGAEDQRWQLALRIAASGSLGRSGLLSDFLLYVVDRSIHGRTEEITEQRIGVVVFGRAKDYDPNDDNIVRSYARKLRKRIEEYFSTEGREETLRLEIPRGGYAPVFSENLPAQISVQPSVNLSALNAVEEEATQEDDGNKPIAVEASEAVTPAAGVGRRISEALPLSWGMLVALLFGILLGAGCMLLRHTPMMVSQKDALSHQLWRQLFSSHHDTFIVPCDDGLVIVQRYIQRPVPLTAYVNGSYRDGVKTDNPIITSDLLKLSSRRFTNVVDLDFAAHLAQLKEVVPERMMIRYAHDLRMDDLRAGNAILIGSDEANPWLELFRSQLHFRFLYDPDPDKPSGFENLYPRTGEDKLYTTKGQEGQTYGIIAYLPNLTYSGHVLIVAGLNTAGTQAAASFLLDPSLMMPTLQRAKTALGDVQPFELLIGAGNVATNASAPYVVLERIGLPQGH